MRACLRACVRVLCVCGVCVVREQVTKSGDVNVVAGAGPLTGPGGFIDISSGTKVCLPASI